MFNPSHACMRWIEHPSKPPQGIEKVGQQNNRYVDPVVEQQAEIWKLCNYELNTFLKQQLLYNTSACNSVH